MLRFAFCNEAFGRGQNTSRFAQVCRAIKHAGFEGIEIAPFTLSESPLDLSARDRRELKDVMAREGLAFAGLHWLMVSPLGLHLTAADAQVRARGWQHISDLTDLAGDLADGPTNMILGSPKQRATSPGVDAEQATHYFIDGLRTVAAHAEQRNVAILVEALPINQCDVITTLDAARAVVDAVNSPKVKSMFDTHNAVDETEPHCALVKRHFDIIRHVHINEIDGRHPGTSNYDFPGLLACLEKLNYGGWVSTEAFDFTPGAQTIALETMDYLRRIQ